MARLHLRRRRVRAQRWLFSTTKGRLTVLSALCVLALAVGLAVQGGFDSPPSASGGDGVGGSADPGTSSAAPSGSASASVTTTADTGPASAQQIKQALQSKIDNPLNNLRGAGIHRVNLSVTSAQGVGTVGYLVPTALSAPYGTVKVPGSSWAYSQRAVGGGYLAAVFIQSGRDGTPVTCRVTIDGKTTNTETTSGQYGLAVCLG